MFPQHTINKIRKKYDKQIILAVTNFRTIHNLEGSKRKKSSKMVAKRMLSSQIMNNIFKRVSTC